MAPEVLARSHEIHGEKWSATASRSVRVELDEDGEPKGTFSCRRLRLQQLTLDYIHEGDDDNETTVLQIHVQIQTSSNILAHI